MGLSQTEDLLILLSLVKQEATWGRELKVYLACAEGEEAAKGQKLGVIC